MKQARRNTLIALSFIICLLSFSATLCSCSSDDETTADSQEDSNGRRMRQLTISNVSMATRATFTSVTTQTGKILYAGWEEGDKATYFNLTLQGQQYGGLVKQGILTAAHLSEASNDAPQGASATLSGSVYCGLGDYLAVIYPAVTIEGTANNAFYTINLREQKGTLDDIGARYHYIFGVGYVESVNGGTATATITNTKSLLSLCKFTFSEKVKKLEINEYMNIDGTDKMYGYPQGKVSIPKYEDMLGVVSVDYVGTANDPALVVDLSKNPSTEVYVAMLPDDNNYYLTVTYEDNRTAVFKKHAKLLEGKYYELQLTQQQ